MGLFDSLAKQALGGILGSNSNQGDLLTSLLNQAGGLNGLMDRFKEAGLTSTFESWVSSNSNQPVEPADLQKVFGMETLQDLASKVGFDVKMVLPLLSQFLPQIIDRLTPNGSIEETHPSAEKLQDVLAGVMKNGLGGLFGGRS